MSIFKNTLRSEIQNQLIARGKAFKNRTYNDLTYINSRNAWVRMSSGVNVEGTDLLARNYILHGGVLNANNELKYNLGSNINNVYSNYTLGVDGKPILNQRGIRPMPGITEVSIQSTSAYGSMRQARINFTCHDIKQLEALELLYMRPGFTVLLEWGWIPYIDNTGKLKNNVDYYNIFDEVGTFEERCKVLFTRSVEKFHGNYDAFLGYIKNYEWTAREDGGYDCMTELMSIGEILESLKINYYPNYITNLTGNGIIRSKLNKLSKAEGDIENREITEEFYKDNITAGVISELIAYGIKATKNDNIHDGVGWSDKDTTGELTGIKDHELHFFRIVINNNGALGNNKIKKSKIEDDDHVYIDLESFVHIFNKHILVQDKNSKTPLIKLSTHNREYDFEEGIFELLCLAHPLQISIDPTVCLIRNDQFKNIEKLRFESTPSDLIGETSNTNDDKKRLRAKSAINNFMKTISLNSNENIQRLHIESFIDYSFKLGSTKNNEDNLKELFTYLANAYENWKQLNLPNDTDPENISKYKQTTFAEILINEWANYGDNTLEKFLNKYQITRNSKEEYKNFLRENMFPDENIKTLSDKSIDQQASTLSTNEALEDLEVNLLFLENLTKGYFYEVEGSAKPKYLGVIGGIYINLTFALSLATSEHLKNQDPKEKKEINVYDYFKSLMYEVQTSIGNLNNFDIHVDPIDNIGRIIDIHLVTLESPKDIYESAFTFLSNNPTSLEANYDGLFNNIRNYKLSSQIFAEQSTVVAISAQNGGGQMGLDNETLVGFNKGITDRIKPESAPPESPSYNNPEDNNALLNTLGENIKILAKFFKDLKWYSIKVPLAGEIVLADRDFDANQVGKYKDALRDIIMTFKAITDDANKFKAIIPTKLSIELDGIGGLIIGHIFRIPNELLPIGYRQENSKSPGRRLGYIITGISHNIQNNDWKTTIDAQTLILEEPEGIQSFDLKNTTLSEPLEQVIITPNVTTSTPINVNNDEITGTNANKLRQVLKELGYTEKGKEIDSGGDITFELYRLGDNLFRKIKQELPNVSINVTSGNDKFHANIGYASRHKKGNALDFTVTPNITDNINKIENILQAYVAGNNPNVRYINEYNNLSSSATGKHFHVSYGLGTEGQQSLIDSLRLVQEGKIKPLKIL